VESRGHFVFLDTAGELGCAGAGTKVEENCFDISMREGDWEKTGVRVKTDQEREEKVIILLSCSSNPAFESAVCASRGKCSNTTDAAIVKGISVWSDSDDASVASASVSVSVSICALAMASGGDGDEDMVVSVDAVVLGCGWDVKPLESSSVVI
jgi:hypothetical protein